MYGSRIVSGLAVVFGGMALLFAALAAVYNLVFFAVAAVFGLAAYFVWYHASGRLARRLYRGVEGRAEPGRGPGVGAGPREEWDPPRDGRTARASAGRANAGRATAGGGTTGSAAGRAGQRGGPRRAPPQQGPTAREAYDALGLDPDADEAAVKTAYREKVKAVHPDRPGGDEERFKEVQAAYDRLSDD